MRLERIIIELTNVERGWNEENKSSILANAIRNALGPHRAKAYQLFAEEMEAAYFLALNARHITTPSNSGQVLLELICALPLVGRTRQDQARRGLLSAVNTINPDDNAGWHWRCRIHLLETESSTDAIACAFDDILSGIGKLPSTTQASLLAELIRYATKHHALFLVGSGTALNRYADFREKIRQLDVCDQPAVLAALAGMLASPPLAVEAPRLFITMYRDATALADPGSKALVLRSLMGVLHVCPQGNERRNVLCTIVDDALLLGDAYAAAVLCGMDPQMRISHFADHIERYVARFLESRIQRLASPYQREVSDKLFEFFEQFRRHNDMLLG